MNIKQHNQLGASIISLQQEIEDLTKISKGKNKSAQEAKILLPQRKQELRTASVKFNRFPMTTNLEELDNLDDWSSL